MVFTSASSWECTAIVECPNITNSQDGNSYCVRSATARRAFVAGPPSQSLQRLRTSDPISYEETVGLRKIGTMTCKICDGDLALRCLLPLRVANRLFLQILLAASDDLWAASPAIITPLAFRRLPQFLGRDEMTNAAILYCFPRERRSATTFVKSRESRARRIAAQTGAVQSVISSFHCKSEPGGLS